MRHFKLGVVVVWTEATLTIQDVVEQVFGAYGYHWVITAGRDGTHMLHSKHGRDEALDVRSRQIKEEDLPHILDELRTHLGKDFDVVFESDHIHIEWDPKP